MNTIIKTKAGALSSTVVTYASGHSLHVRGDVTLIYLGGKFLFQVVHTTTAHRWTDAKHRTTLQVEAAEQWVAKQTAVE